jgi:hypothetical protein
MTDNIKLISDLLGVAPGVLVDEIATEGAWFAVATRIYFAEDSHFYSAVDYGIEDMTEEEALDPDEVAAWIEEVQFWGRRYITAQEMIDGAFGP